MTLILERVSILKISPQRRGQKLTPLGETLPKKHH